MVWRCVASPSPRTWVSASRAGKMASSATTTHAQTAGSRSRSRARRAAGAAWSRFVAFMARLDDSTFDSVAGRR